MAYKKNTKKKIDEVTFETVKSLQVNDVVNEIGTLQVGIQQQLANISAAITGKLEQLNSTENAVRLMQDRLKEIYDIEKEALSLEEVRLRRTEEDERYNKMIISRNNEWQEEQENHHKQWEREIDEHNYEVTLSKKKFIDEFSAEIEAHKRSEKIRTEELQKNWNQRDSEIKAKETKFTELEKLVASFDDRLKTEIGKAEAIAANSVKKSYEHQMQLLQKDQESERNMSNTQIQSCEITITSLQKQIFDLQNQLNASRMDAKEVTAQALQSASGRQVADALQRVVDAKDNGKTK